MIKVDYNNPCESQISITIPLLAEDARKLRDALDLIKVYKKIALKEMMPFWPDPTTCDWHNIQYCVDSDKFTVIVKEGMIG